MTPASLLGIAQIAHRQHQLPFDLRVIATMESHDGAGRMKRALVIALLAIIVAAPSAHARPGDLDPSFSEDGFSTVLPNKIGSWANEIVVLPNGRILIAGGGVTGYESAGLVARFLPDGSRNRNFGGGTGFRFHDFGLGDASISGLAVTPSGKIVVGGTFVWIDDHIYPFVARLLSDGRIDESFGKNGVVDLSDRAPMYWITDLAVDAEGRTIVAGEGTQADDSGAYRAFGVIGRLTAKGAIDESYSGDGFATESDVRWGGFDAMELDSHGRAVAAEVASLGAPPHYVLRIARYRADGSLDPGFSFDGNADTPLQNTGSIDSRDRTANLALADDGVVASASWVSYDDPDGTPHSVLTKVDSGGNPDVGFGQAGVVREESWVSAIDIGPAGALTVIDPFRELDLGIGGMDTGTFALRRLQRDGSSDSSWGTDGVAVVNPSADQYEGLSTLARTPSGELLAGGDAGRYAVVARYLEGPGRDDADADRVADANDQCPLRFGAGAADGCRQLRTRARIFRSRLVLEDGAGEVDALIGAVRSASYWSDDWKGCQVESTPKVFRARSGPDSLLGEVTFAHGDLRKRIRKLIPHATGTNPFYYSGPRIDPRLYVRFPRVHVPTFGTCVATKVLGWSPR